ncbi:hypothetical protein [Mycobacterium sp.]
MLRPFARRIGRGEPTLHIHRDSIDPGLFTRHGFATAITAESPGADRW